MQALRYRKEVCSCGVFYSLLVQQREGLWAVVKSLQFYGPGNSTTLRNRLRGKQVRIKL